jgi:chromosome segregation ATPase
MHLEMVNAPKSLHFIFFSAVITALKSLQEKIRKLELDRSHAKANLEQLSTEAKQCQEKLEEERKLTTPRSQSASPAGILDQDVHRMLHIRRKFVILH